MISYRAALPEDAGALTSIAFASKSHWGYPPEWMELWRPQLQILPEQILQQYFRVAECDAAPVGFSAVFIEGSRAELEHLWVLPQWMRGGIGRHLVDEALRWTAARGFDVLTVIADPGAAPFYERMGAVLIGQRPSVPPGRALPQFRFDLSRV